MARVELDSTDTTAQWLVSRFRRYFFVLLALLSILIASTTFVPVFLKFAAGTFPIAWVLNIHGALMGTWLALFLAQAMLASTGRLALHRKLGTFGIVLGFPVWASMVLVEMRGKVVHPLASDLSKAYDWDLPGIYVYTTFLIFLIGAIYQRRRWPAWHKRFMAFATFVAVQAAEQRNSWLPRFAPGYWTDVFYLDICHFRGRERWCGALATLVVNTRIDKRWRVHLPEYSMIACDRRFSFSGDPKMVPSGGFRYVSILR
jgi:hypothetical protein